MKLKCLICGDIIESKSIHDLVSCKCESCYIDGGKEYEHIGAKDFTKIVKITDDGREIHYESKDGIQSYKVEIEEVLQRIVMINAENREEALKSVKEKYKNEEIVLNTDDYKCVEFKIEEETQNG